MKHLFGQSIDMPYIHLGIVLFLFTHQNVFHTINLVVSHFLINPFRRLVCPRLRDCPKKDLAEKRTFEGILRRDNLSAKDIIR